MYLIPPTGNCDSSNVVLVEPSDTDPDAIIEMAREGGAIAKDGDQVVFWVWFEEEDVTPIDFTEPALRRCLSHRTL